jgi:hypothetical protein
MIEIPFPFGPLQGAMIGVLVQNQPFAPPEGG